MTADWDALVDAAPPEVREALDRLRHHVALTTPGADPVGRRDSTWTGRAEVHRAAREAMGSLLAWAVDRGGAAGSKTTRFNVCDFDGGPLHEATIRIPHEGDDGLPVVLVTDAGDWWSTYVLLDRRDDERFRRYSYDGEAKPGEIDRCPRVPKGNRVDTEEATTS